MTRVAGVALLLVMTACQGVVDFQPPDGGLPPDDAGSLDAGTIDGGDADAGALDAGTTDAGTTDAGTTDAGTADAGTTDAGTSDAGTSDAGTSDAGTSDAGTSDAGTSDAGTSDAGTADAGTADAGTADAGGIDAGLQSCTIDAQCTASNACDVSWCSAGQCVHQPRVCNAPPPPTGDPFATCRDGGTTFKARLGGTCNNTRCVASTGCIYEEVDVACPPANTLTSPATPGRLPQKQPWQVVLRNWLATLSTQDFSFTLPTPPFSFNPTQFPDGDLQARERLFAAWLIFGRGREVPDLRGLRLPADRFTLSSIEDTTAGLVRMRVGYRGWFQPESVAFWSQWDWPGSPYRNLRSVRLRALAASSIDLMMSTDALSTQPAYTLYDVGGLIPRASYPYLVARTELDACTQAAYEQGLRELITASEGKSWTTANGNNDIYLSMLAGLHWAAKSTRDPELHRRAVSRTQGLFAAAMHHPAGWFEHSNANDPGAGFDSSYEGISTYHVTSAVLATLDEPDYAFLRGELRKMIALKAAMTLPSIGVIEPAPQFGASGRAVMSPVAFCPATNGGSAWDQWNGRARDYGLAAFDDEAVYLPFAGRPTDFYRLQGLPTVSQLKQEHADLVALNTTPSLNRVGGFTDPSTPFLPENDPRAPGWLRWSLDGWTEHLGASQLLPPDTYARISALVASNSPLLKLPLERPGDFVRRAGDDFVWAKFSGYGAVLHLGPIGRDWGDSGSVSNRDVLVTGFGGGQVASFSVADAGAVWLGVAKGFQSTGRLSDGGTGPTQDRWEDFRDWPIHAVSGLTTAGKIFTSGRILNPVITLNTTGTTATATATGPITWDFTNHVASQSNALTSPLTYTRQFQLAASGIQITTSVTGNGTVQVSELFESLPVNIYGGVSAAHKPGNAAPSIDLVTTTGTVSWNAGMAGAQTALQVSEVRIHRAGRGVRVTFTGGSRTVRLSPNVWSVDAQQYLEGRALQVDLLQATPPVALNTASLTYTLSPMP